MANTAGAKRNATAAGKAKAVKKTQQKQVALWVGTFTGEDLGLIKSSCDKKRRPKRALKEYPDKQWKRRCVGKIYRKLRKAAPATRKEGSGSVAFNRTEAEAAKVRAALGEKENKGAQGGSARVLVAKVCLEKTTPHAICQRNLKLKSLAQAKCQRLSEKNREPRLKFCAGALRALDSGEVSLDSFVFLDEAAVRCSATKMQGRTI